MYTHALFYNKEMIKNWNRQIPTNFLQDWYQFIFIS